MNPSVMFLADAASVATDAFGYIATIAGVAVTVAGLVATVIVFLWRKFASTRAEFRQEVAAQMGGLSTKMDSALASLSEAKADRGKMEMRLDEVEGDVEKLNAKTDKTSNDTAKLYTALEKVAVGLDNVVKRMDEDRAERRSTPFWRR